MTNGESGRMEETSSEFGTIGGRSVSDEESDTREHEIDWKSKYDVLNKTFATKMGEHRMVKKNQERRISELEKDIRIRDFLADAGMPKEFNQFLTGDTEEEWQEEVDVIAKYVKSQTSQNDQTSRQNESRDQSIPMTLTSRREMGVRDGAVHIAEESKRLVDEYNELYK